MARTIEFDIEVNGIEQITESALSARQQLKLLTDAINNDKLSGDKLRQAEAAAGALRDRIGDTRQRINALASDTAKLDAVVSGVRGIAAGFAVAQGAAALFGDENKNVQEAILKTQAALSILNGVQEISNLLNKDSAFSTIAAASAQKLYAGAIALSSGALGTFRTALIATGIGAAVVLVGALVANWDKLSDAISGSNDVLRENKKLNEDVGKAVQNDIAALKILKAQIEDENLTREQKNNLIDDSIKKYPELLDGYTKEELLNGKITQSIKDQTDALIAREKIKILASQAAQKQVDIDAQIADKEAKLAELQTKPLGRFELAIGRAGDIGRAERDIASLKAQRVALDEEFQAQFEAIKKNIPKLYDEAAKADDKEKKKSTTKAKESVKKTTEEILKENAEQFAAFKDSQLKGFDIFYDELILKYKQDYIDGIIKSEDELTTQIEAIEIERLNARETFLQQTLTEVQTNVKLDGDFRISEEQKITAEIVKIQNERADKTIALNKKVAESNRKVALDEIQAVNSLIEARQTKALESLKLLNDNLAKTQRESYQKLILEQQKESVKTDKILFDGKKRDIEVLGGLQKANQDEVVNELFDIFEIYNKLNLTGPLIKSSDSEELTKLLNSINAFQRKYGELTNNPPFNELLGFKQAINDIDQLILKSEGLKLESGINKDEIDLLKNKKEFILLELQLSGESVDSKKEELEIIDKQVEALVERNKVLSTELLVADVETNLNRNTILTKKYNEQIQSLYDDLAKGIIKTESDLAQRLSIIQLQKNKQELATLKTNQLEVSEQTESALIKLNVSLKKKLITQEEYNTEAKKLNDASIKAEQDYNSKLEETNSLEVKIIEDTYKKSQEILQKQRQGLIGSIETIASAFTITGRSYEVGINGLLNNVSNLFQSFFKLNTDNSIKSIKKQKAEVEKAAADLKTQPKTDENVVALGKLTQEGLTLDASLKDKRTQIAGLAANTLSSLGATLSDLGQTIEKERLDRLQRQNDVELSLLEDRFNKGLISEQEYNDQRLSINKKYQEEETKIKKKAFNIDKAAKISQAISATALAVISALSVPGPAGFILAGLAGTLGAVQVGLIARQKFEGGSSEFNSAVGSAGELGGAESAQAAPSALPRFNVNTGQVEGSNLLMSSGLTSGGAGGNAQQVYVLESDIRQVSNRVEVYEGRSKFG